MAAPPFDQQITFLYTRDLEASARFYEGVLGLPLVLDQGTCRIYRAAQAGYLGVCARADAPPGQQSALIITLVTPDVDGWYARLIASGVAIEHPPRHNPIYAIYHFFLRDPNGYLIEIQRFETLPGGLLEDP
jgi:catechol 2,3-dioxygenase-like lactoylglutathione lyase family enzyme